MPTLFTPGIRLAYLPVLARRANLIQRFEARGSASAAAPLPVPPVPPGPHAGPVKPFLSRDPRARFKPTDQPNARLARATELLSSMVNSLMGKGQIVQLGPSEWTIDPSGFTTGLNGLFSGHFIDSITFAHGQAQAVSIAAIVAADLPLVSGAIAGDYSNPTLHVDQYGRITSIVSGSAPSSGISIGDAVGSALTGLFKNLLMTDTTGHLSQATADGDLSWRVSGGIGTFRVGSNAFSLDTSGSMVCSATQDTITHLIIAWSSQTENLSEWDDFSGALLSRVNKDGYFMTRKVAAPADADVATSEASWWLVDTATSPDVRFKMKDAAGTVFSAAVPMTLFAHHANAGNVTTGETDLYSDTIPANRLAANDETLEAEYGGVFVSSGTATRDVRLYFGGTKFFDSGALTLSLSAAWTIYVSLIRVSATVIRYMVSMTTEGAALAAYTAVGEITGLTLSNTNILKITGQAAGVGAATNDIVAYMSKVVWQPAP